MLLSKTDDREQEPKVTTLEYLLWRDAGWITARAELARSALLAAKGSKSPKQRQDFLDAALNAIDEISALARR